MHASKLELDRSNYIHRVSVLQLIILRRLLTAWIRLCWSYGEASLWIINAICHLRIAITTTSHLVHCLHALRRIHRILFILVIKSAVCSVAFFGCRRRSLLSQNYIIRYALVNWFCLLADSCATMGSIGMLFILLSLFLLPNNLTKIRQYLIAFDYFYFLNYRIRCWRYIGISFINWMSFGVHPQLTIWNILRIMSSIGKLTLLLCLAWWMIRVLPIFQQILLHLLHGIKIVCQNNIQSCLLSFSFSAISDSLKGSWAVFLFGCWGICISIYHGIML